MDNSIVIYQSGDGKTHLEVKYEEDTLWLSQQQICDLYQTSKSNVSEHIKHIFEDRELKEESVVRKFRTTAADGKKYNVTHYNLDMILSIGYRTRSCKTNCIMPPTDIPPQRSYIIVPIPTNP